MNYGGNMFHSFWNWHNAKTALYSRYSVDRKLDMITMWVLSGPEFGPAQPLCGFRVGQYDCTSNQTARNHAFLFHWISGECNCHEICAHYVGSFLRYWISYVPLCGHICPARHSCKYNTSGIVTIQGELISKLIFTVYFSYFIHS
jgi:hypothetical protein